MEKKINNIRFADEDIVPYSYGNLTIKQGKKLVSSLLPFIKDELQFFENVVHIIRAKT